MTIRSIAGDAYTPPPPPPPKPATYKVQPGDSLESIAQAHHTEPETIAKLNHIDLSYPHAVVIRPGQELQLPQPSAEETNQAAADPVVQALNNYDQVANSTRNSQIIAAHAGHDPDDPALELNLDQAQNQLNQAVAFQAAVNQRAGAASDPNEINSLVQHYGGLAQFTNNSFAQSGLSDAASNLNSPQAAKVDQIFNQVAAPTANNGNLIKRENQFANALAGQPPAVVAAVRNDPRYQPLLNQFINANVGNSANPPSSNDPEAQAKWHVQAQKSLVSLTTWLTGRPGKFNGLPPSVAADVVNSPQAQALLANINSYQAPGGPYGQEEQTSFNFQCESQIADALGSTTPAAKQFTQEMAQQIIGTLQSNNVPPGSYAAYLDVKDNLGAPPTASDNQQAPSPALAIAIAQQLQAGGDTQDAHDIINDAASAVNNLATSSSSTSVSVTRALSDYQKKTEDLNWMISNLGGGATPQQVNQAVQQYMKNQGPAWNADYQQDKVILQASGAKLASDISQLENLPSSLKTPAVNSTLKSLAGNTSVQQAIGFALGNQPTSVLGSNGDEGEAVAKFLELSKSGVELATAIAQLDLKNQLEPQLLGKLQGLTPGSAQYKSAIQSTLQDFMEEHSTLAELAGLNDKSIGQLSDIFPSNAASESSEDLKNDISKNLKEFEKAPPLLKNLALVTSTFGFFQATKEAIDDPSAANVFSAFASALGFTQSAAVVAGSFDKVPSQIVDFGNGDSVLGDVAGKVIGAASLLGSIENLGSDIQDGNTWGIVGNSAGIAGTALDLLPEELAGDAIPGLDIASDLLTVGSLVIGVGQLLFSEGPQPPSLTDQWAFLKSEGFNGLSPNVLWDLEQTSNPVSGTPGSSPWKLLVKYAQDSGYNLQDATQRTAFVNWVNKLADTPDANNRDGAEIGGKPVSQLGTLVQNLDAELDYSKGNVANFPKNDSANDQDLAKLIRENRVDDMFQGNIGPLGVTDPDFGNSSDHVVLVNPGPSHAGVIAPQSANQINQLLQVIGASGLPSPPKG